MTQPSHGAGRPGLPPLPPELDPRGGPRRVGRRRAAAGDGRPRSGRRAAALLAKVLCAVLSTALLAYIGFAWNTVRGLNGNASRVTVSSLGGGTVDTVTGTVTHRYDIDGNDQNLLIVGNDDRSQLTDKQVAELKVGRDGGSLSTDTMLIVHVPADGSKATLISLPRDSYVTIPGYGMNKLNAAYGFAYNAATGSTKAKIAAGANLLVQTIENLTGLNIDHFVQVTLLGFVTISDAVGGVPINLCKDVNDTVAYNRSIGGDGGSGFHMSKGPHRISGVQALEFVRQRHNLPLGDLDRTRRQRYFLTAAFRQIASAGTLLNLNKLKDLIQAVNKSIYIDQGLNMLDLARQMSKLSANNIQGEAIPFDRFWNDSPVGSVEVVTPATVQAFVAKMVAGTDAAYAGATAAAPSSVTVQVVNGGAADGAAARAVSRLAHLGFRSSVDSHSDQVTSTVIRYPRGQEAAAKAVAQYVPAATVQRRTDVSGVVLVLGADGASVHTSTPKHAAANKRGRKHTVSHHKALDSGCIN